MPLRNLKATTVALGVIISFASCWEIVSAASPVMLRAGTVTELINAVNTANTSHEPTVIRVSAGHYEFTRTFNSSYGPSVLPVINGNITLIGASPAATVLDAQGNGRFWSNSAGLVAATC